MKEYSISLSQIRKKAIEAFVEVTELLNKYKIEYWLDYGTLLGAIRDKTIIPWDGEFDISAMDSNIDLNSKIWKELEDLGYVLNFGEFNIKIRKKSQLIGSFVIDLHRYKETVNGALYEYGRKPKSKFENLIFYIHRVIYTALPIENVPNITFTRIYNEIMNKTGAKISEIDCTEVIIKIGETNKCPFVLFFKEKKIEFDVLARRKFLTKALYYFFSALPLSLNKLLINKLEKNLNKIEFIPLKRVYIKNYYKNLTTTEFCGLNFPCFKESQLYLKDVYGANWSIPTNKWELIHDSPLSKK